MARREYKAGVPTILAAAIDSSTLTIPISSYVNWPTGAEGNFWVTIDGGTAQEERVLCSAHSSGNITVATRGMDETTARSHSQGAVIWPSWSATDADESNAHINATGYASYSLPVHGLGSGDGVVVGTNKTQELTAKTINLTSNTLSGTTAQFNTALSDNNFATEAGLASAVATHEADTTSVHGIADTSKLPNIASASAGRTIFVQAATPTALAVGDIWFQVTGL